MTRHDDRRAFWISYAVTVVVGLAFLWLVVWR